MGRPGEGLTDFLTFISPCIIIVLFFLCLFRFLFTCCACKLKFPKFRRSNPSNASSTEAGLSVHSMGAAQHCSLNMPSLPLNYVEYDNSLFPSTFMFSTERFPPKYEDAIKLPSATPRRSSCSAIPPPFYDTSTITIEAANDYTNPPAYWSLSRQGTVHGIRPTVSGITTISNTTNNAFLMALPSPSVPNTNAPMELSPAMLAEKRLRVGLNAVRHASLTTQDQMAINRQARPITSIRSSTTFVTNQQQRPFTTHSRLVTSLPGQIAEANSTRSLDEEPSIESEKLSQS